VVLIVFVVVVEAADPAYEVAPALVPGPLVNNLTSSLLRLGDMCSAASRVVALAAGMEIPATEEEGRYAMDQQMQKPKKRWRGKGGKPGIFWKQLEVVLLA